MVGFGLSAHVPISRDQCIADYIQMYAIYIVGKFLCGLK